MDKTRLVDGRRFAPPDASNICLVSLPCPLSRLSTPSYTMQLTALLLKQPPLSRMGLYAVLSLDMANV